MENYYYEDYDSYVSDDLVDVADYIKSPISEWSSHDLIPSLYACIPPSLTQISSYVLVLVGTSAIFHIICHLLRRLPTNKYIESMQHITALLCGLIALYATLGSDMQLILIFSMCFYVLLLILDYYSSCLKNNAVLFVIIGTHFCCETLWQAPEMWQRIRGIQMVAMMKTISLYYDLQAEATNKQISKLKTTPGLLSYLGYILSPTTCILGPWISYTDYLKNLRTSSFALKPGKIFSCCFNILLAISFLILSNCLVPLVGEHAFVQNWKWLGAYRDAISVRCSHYFICFLSQATLTACGQTLHDQHAILGPLVVRPWQIEFPRSITCVVRAWNLPMHNWLRNYIFQPLQSGERYILAVLFTYAVSALLHGLHLRIYLVLLSLAVFGFIENKLRSKLAYIFNACIAGSPCKRQLCKYEFCGNRLGYKNPVTWLVALMNIVFSTLIILNLAYLGILMDTSNNNDSLTAIDEIWSKWSNLNFLSHWFALASFVFYCLI